MEHKSIYTGLKMFILIAFSICYFYEDIFKKLMASKVNVKNLA